MALIDCPDCAKRISDSAAACPQCGYPVQKRARDNHADSARDPRPPLPQPPDASVPARASHAGGVIVAFKCPMCGGAAQPRSRSCSYCGALLLITGAAALLHQSVDAAELARATGRWKGVLSERPHDIEATYALGMLYLQAGLLDVAIAHLRRAIDLMPESALARYNLAQALLNVSDAAQLLKAHQEAREQIEFCLKIDPEFKEAASWRQVFLATDRINTPQESIPLLYEAVQRCPDVPEFYENYAFGLLNGGHYPTALQTLQAAVSLNPRSSFSHGMMAFALFRTDQCAKGIPWGEKAISLFTASELKWVQAYCHNALALCLWKHGDRPGAVRHIEVAVGLAPNYVPFSQNRDLIKGVTTASQSAPRPASAGAGAKIAAEIGGAFIRGLLR